MYIERFPNLEVLVVNSNCDELNGITLSNNKKLTRVSLSPANGLWSSLNVSGLENLTTFELKFSNDQANLSKINLSNCPALKKVVVEGAKFARNFGFDRFRIDCRNVLVAVLPQNDDRGHPRDAHYHFRIG